jgi:hypothetical protein
MNGPNVIRLHYRHLESYSRLLSIVEVAVSKLINVSVYNHIEYIINNYDPHNFKLLCIIALV